eukprot:GEZU01023036.1.p1 GENE.GEZU01023036.1~~GEZU01023036.1.p1  ORF type:complete len:295 (-),score=50.97 GEZU01023036.1:306-1190(-)
MTKTAPSLSPTSLVNSPKKTTTASTSSGSSPTQNHSRLHGTNNLSINTTMTSSLSASTSVPSTPTNTTGNSGSNNNSPSNKDAHRHNSFTSIPRSLAPTRKKKMLVLDLDETLVHSSPIRNNTYHYTLNVAIPAVANVTSLARGRFQQPQQCWCTFYVSERPHLNYFMKKVCDWYDVVIFTASLDSYANPVINRIDKQKKITARYFRETCVQVEEQFVKDLSKICDDLSQCIIIDNSAVSYAFHPENAIPIKTWMADDPNDKELLNLLPLLESLRHLNDVRSILKLRHNNLAQM